MASFPATQVQQLRQLQSELNAAIETHVANTEQGRNDGLSAKAVSKAARQVVTTVEDPIEQVVQIGFQATQHLATRIAVDLDLFNIIDERTSLDELTTKTGVERILLFRILRLLVAMSIILELEPEVYSATTASRILRAPSLRDWIKATFDSLLPVWVQTPEYLRKTGFKDFCNTDNNPVRAMHGSEFFQHLSQHPKREADFMSAMKFQDLAPPEQLPQFPFSESFGSFEVSVKEGGSDVFLVDIGGGNGQYLDRLIRENPQLPGRKVFQDLPTVIAKADPNKTSAEPMAHDFFTPQPIHVAKFYHMRGILHDWPDRECVQILKQLRPAFKHGSDSLGPWGRPSRGRSRGMQASVTAMLGSRPL